MDKSWLIEIKNENETWTKTRKKHEEKFRKLVFVGFLNRIHNQRFISLSGM